MICNDHADADVSAGARTRQPPTAPALPEQLSGLWQIFKRFADAQGAHAALVLQAAGARLALVVVITLMAAMAVVAAWALMLGFALFHLALFAGWPLAVVVGVLINLALAGGLLHAARVEVGRMQGYWTAAGLASAHGVSRAGTGAQS